MACHELVVSIRFQNDICFAHSGDAESANFETIQLYIGAATIIILARTCKLPARIASAFLWLGDLSYPLYLAHPATYLTLGLLLAHHRPVDWGVYMIAALALAAIVLHAVDYPIRRAYRPRPHISDVVPEAVILEPHAAG